MRASYLEQKEIQFDYISPFVVFGKDFNIEIPNTRDYFKGIIRPTTTLIRSINSDKFIRIQVISGKKIRFFIPFVHNSQTNERIEHLIIVNEQKIVAHVDCYYKPIEVNYKAKDGVFTFCTEEEIINPVQLQLNGEWTQKRCVYKQGDSYRGSFELKEGINEIIALFESTTGKKILETTVENIQDKGININLVPTLVVGGREFVQTEFSGLKIGRPYKFRANGSIYRNGSLIGENEAFITPKNGKNVYEVRKGNQSQEFKIYAIWH